MSWFMQLHQKYWPMFLSSVQRKDYPEEACLAFQLEVEFVRAFPLLGSVGVSCKGCLGSRLCMRAAEGALLLSKGMWHRGKICLLGNVCFQSQEGQLDKQV